MLQQKGVAKYKHEFALQHTYDCRFVDLHLWPKDIEMLLKTECMNWGFINLISNFQHNGPVYTTRPVFNWC